MNKRNGILLTFVVLKFMLQYALVNETYELHRDEFLHLDQGNHLAWGFVSVPPLTSCISKVIYFFGNTLFWIRFFPALFGALTLVLVWKAVEELKGNLFALILAATALLFSVLLRLNILYQPNSLDVLCWTAFYFTFLKYINSTNSKWLYAGAFIFAIGFLNKYNIVFILIGLLPAILLTAQRPIFYKSAFYKAILMTLLLIAPNLWWQYVHHFPVFHHLKELTDTQLVNVSRLGFLKEQVLYFLGASFVLFAAFYALVFYVPFNKYRVFLWSFCITLAVFIYLKAKGYYAIGLYPIYLAFGSVYLGEVLKGTRTRANYWRIACILLPFLFFIPMYNTAFPNKSPAYILEHPDTYRALGLLKWEDGKDHALPQDFADMLGWKELADKVDLAFSTLPEREPTLVLCDNYGQAGAINYYKKTKQMTAVSFNADYIHWMELDKKYVNLIRIKNYGEVAEELRTTSPLFVSTTIADSVVNPYAREFGTTIFIFRKARIDVNERIRQEIATYGNY
ncbi:glycosyltransferase family 39 protein [Olivibacter sp. CPCC 100613]|uniref:ArnT family glycosyltransferase n=1 Tax=Olivibacter sp. CPCC 100613 TaxID=3079931 RepID=UPI002FF4C963